MILLIWLNVDHNHISACDTSVIRAEESNIFVKQFKNMHTITVDSKKISAQKSSVLNFDAKLDPASNPEQVYKPAVNISETALEYLLVIATPGLKREDVSVEIEDGILVISAQRAVIECGTHDRWEYDVADWNRKFMLPEDADAMFVLAKYENGELRIRIPRTDITENKLTSTVYVY